MIYCTINGQAAYPSASDKIKVTYANQYIEDSGSYTYDISFPMSIHANQVLFANIHRFDVHKRSKSFDDCKFYADNRLFISGKGTITSVSDTTVKMQIVGGKSRIKYNSKFENHFVDKVPFPKVYITHGIDKAKYQGFGLTSIDAERYKKLIMVDLSTDFRVGQPGVALFYPIYDETNDQVSNYIRHVNVNKLVVDGVHYPHGHMVQMQNLAVQPNLIYVLKGVLESEGYKIVRNDFDAAPYTSIYIASARRTAKINEALPHWSVYTFIEEFRKRFNATFVFDDLVKEVSVISTNELTSNNAVAYECMGEYSAEFDEDGLENLATSNVEYSFDSSANRDWREFIPLSVLKQYPIKEYKSEEDMNSAAMAMSTRERRSTIFKLGLSYFIWALLPKDGNPENKDLTEQRTVCGMFNPILRDAESDNAIGLKMIPVAMFQRKRRAGIDASLPISPDLMPNSFVVMPSTANEGDSLLDGLSEDEDGDYYLSVQDAMQGTEDNTSEETADEPMRLMLSDNAVRDLDKNITTTFPASGSMSLYPIAYTDFREFSKWAGERFSLSLEATELSVSGLKKNNGIKVDIDAHNLYTIKFIADDIPDPSNIYIFNNRRFVCQKIEMEVTGEGLDRVKTGYFYAIL
ncbi:MAG: hypothetical protein SO028_05410 [Prevotella sp.]|nr:hypothetical protein [Prevotella sp.]